MVGRNKEKLKADRPHPRDYPPTPPDYRHTDKTLELVMPTLYSKCEDNCLDTQTHTRTDGRTDGRHQLHYLPRFAVDNNLLLSMGIH